MLCRSWLAVLLSSSGPLLFASACATAQEQTATAENVEELLDTDINFVVQ